MVFTVLIWGNPIIPFDPAVLNDNGRIYLTYGWEGMVIHVGLLKYAKDNGWYQGINQGIKQGKSLGAIETKEKTALIMLQDGELSIDKIAKYSGLEVAEVERLAGIQTV